MTHPDSQWISVNIQIGESQRELAMDFAMSLGGLAIVEQAETFQVSYLLDDNASTILSELKTSLKDLAPDAKLTEEVVEWENWNKNWQAYFKPTEITPGLIVLPEWEAPEDFSHQVKIRIQPAMAFGTGTHETTQLCLQFLEENIQGQEQVLDLGTGSGILGIAALLLGAGKVDALENDPYTEQNISDNLMLNGITQGFTLQITESPTLNSPYDLMVVNIIRARLYPLLPHYYQALKPGGRVIIAGLLATEDAETRELLANSPWDILKYQTKNEWIAYLCEVK